MVVTYRGARRVLGLVVLAFAVSLCAAPWAFGAPSEPMMGIAELRAALATSPTGTLSGHFKTVLKGYTISEVDATIVAVVTDSPTASLILFTSSGDAVAGGIASGMSGSPLYVDDAGTDKMVGAVAYAGDFALNGAGLATPIEDMAAVESATSYNSATLDRPVIAGRSIVGRIILTDEPTRYAGEAAAGAIVAHPLSSAFIGGVKSGSGAFKLFDAALTRTGLAVTPMAKGGVSAATLPSQNLEPGASIAALVATGDAWIGGVGTETYRNGDNIMAFGHPLLSLEPTQMFLTDAWVDGSWQSSWSSFKFASPTSAPRGAFVKDRAAGCMAVFGQDVPVTTVTAHATRLSAAGATLDETSTAVQFSRPMFNSPVGYAYSAAGAVALAGYRLFPGVYCPGSASTTTTVVVSDGAQTRTVKITNLLDDARDISVATSNDVAFAIDQLMSVHESGLYAAQLTILSVDLDVAYSPVRKLARVNKVDAPNGLKVGDNLVRVELAQYGIAAPLVIEKTLTIPAGTPLTGRLTATCANQLSGGSSIEELLAMLGGESGDDSSGIDDRRTIAEIVEDINGTLAYNDLVIRLAPIDADSEEGASESGSSTGLSTETSVSTGVYLTGEASKLATSMKLTAVRSTVGYAEDAVITGELAGAPASSTVEIYATTAGGSERLVETVKTGYIGESDTPGFSVLLPGLKRNTSVRAVFKATTSAVSAEQSTVVRVKAKPSLSASSKRIKKGKSVKLTAKVYPAGTAGSTVVYEYYSKRYRGWRTIATRTLVAKNNRAEALKTWRIRSAGRWKVRVRTLNGATNAAAASKAVTIIVK